MTEFDISILSTLDIDTDSSRRQINEKIKSISDKVNKIYAEVEVKDTKANADALRKSANRIIDNVKNTGSIKKINVELDVNMSKSRNNINKSISTLSKEFSGKKIDVSLNTKLDRKSIAEAQREATKSSRGSTLAPSDIVGKNDIYRKEGSSAKKYSEAILNLAKQYQNVNEIQNSLTKNIDTNVRTQIKAIKDATGAVKQYQISLERLDESGKVTRKRVLNYDNNKNGLSLQKDTLTDSSDKVKKQVQEQITNEVRKQIANAKELARLEKISEDNLKRVLLAYDDLLAKNAKYRANLSDLASTKNSTGEVLKLAQEHKKIQDDHIESQRKMSNEAQSLIDKFRAMERVGKINDDQFKKIKNSLSDAQNEAAKLKLSPDSWERVKRNTKEIADTIVSTNNLYKQQQNLLTTIESLEKRKADSIDKYALNSLKKQTQNMGGIGQPFPKDAAYQMSQIHNQVRQISAEADRATRSQMGFVESFRQAMVKFPVWMGATTLFFGAIRTAKEFMSTIVEIDSKMVTLAKVMGDGTDLASVFQKANEAALQYGQTISGVLDVYAEFARQGYKGDELTQFGNAGLIAANVGEISPKQASEYLTSMSAQWETSATQAMRQVDSLNEISNNYATTVEKLAQGQAKAGSTAKQMGMSFDETNAVIGALTAKTKQSGDEIGNFMKAILPSLYNGKGKDTIEGLGINFKDQQGQIKGAMRLLEEVSYKIKDMDKAQQAAIINGIGGKYHYQRLQVLLDDLAKTDSLYKSIKDTSENSAGSALKENATYMESVEAKINKAKVSIEQLGVVLGDAFLKSGMLDAIRVFTDLMTGLVAIVSKMGSSSLIIGAFGAAVSLFSKNVRSGFSGARKSIADFIAESYELRQAKKNMDATNAASSITGNMQASPISKDSGANARSATQANNGLANALKSVGLQGPFAAAGIERGNRAAAASATIMRAGKMAAIGFGAALKGIIASTGVGLVIAGISFALEKLIGHFDKAKQSAEAYQQQQEQMKQAVQSMPQSEIQSLINKHEELKNKMNSGQTFNSQEVEQYKNVVSQLANIFPDLVTGEGKYGQTINGNKAIMDARIKSMREELQLQKEVDLYKKQQETADFIKEKDKEAQGGGWFKRTFTASPEEQVHKAGMHNTSDLGNSEIMQLDKKMQKIKDLKSAEEALRLANKAYSEAAKQGNDREVNSIKKKIDAINDYKGKVNMANSASKAAIAAAAQEFTSQAALMKHNNQLIGASGQSVMMALSNAVQNTAKSGKQADEIFKHFNATLTMDSGFKAKMASYEAALSKFKKAQGTSREGAALAQLENAYSDVTRAVIQSANASKMDKKSKQQLLTSLHSLIQDETKLAFKIDKEGNALADTTNESKKNTKATNENSRAKEVNAEASDEVAKKNKELADSVREAAGAHELLNKAQAELGENGTLSIETIEGLMEKYGEEVLAAMNDTETLNDFIMKKREEETEHFNETMRVKLENSEIYYKTVAKAGGDFANYLKETYGIDAENFTSLAEVKGKINNMYYGDSVEDQEKVINAIAEAYHIDLSNYGNLADKKEALENALMEILGEKWNEYVTTLDEDMSALGVETGGSVGKKKPNTSKRFDAGKFISANLSEFKNATGLSTDFRSSLGELSNKLRDAGNGADKIGGAAGNAAKGLKESAEAAEKAGIAVEVLYKTFTITTYVADELAMALDRVNHQLEKQKINTQKYATWSQKYRNSLKEENKLLDEKTRKLNEQIRSFEDQIRNGKVIEYGLVNEDIELPYLQYTAENMSGGKVASINGLTGNSNEQKVWNFLKSQGFSDVQAAGIMGNFEAESGMNPAAEQMRGWVGGKGLAQWDNRKDNLKRFADSKGKPWTDLYTQLQFMMYELKTSESRAYSSIKTATTVDEATRIWLRDFERAGIPHTGRRLNSANNYYNKFKGTSGITAKKSNVINGMQGKSILSDNTAYVLDKQFGHYNGGGTHYGRDLTGSNVNNSQIRAAKSGVVTFAGWTGGGNTISIFDGTNTYTYMHMIRPSNLRKGQSVAAGQVVGNVGTTYDRSLGGFSTGPHLHVQLNKGKTPSGTFIDTFNGPHAAIDPERNGYFRVNGNSNWSGLADYSLASGSYNEGQVEALNQAEEARMAQIEAAIAEFNAGEAMKQKVDELKKTLMDTQLERLKTIAEKNENVFNIAKSQAESYDHLKELQEAKSNRLTYELNKVEFEKGRNNEEWRKKNKELQASRAIEQDFVIGKKDFVNKVLKDNPDKIFEEDSVYRDEFEKLAREADNTIREIKEGIQHSNGEIAASLIDQIIEEYTVKYDSLQSKIDKIGKEREQLDVEDNAQAEKSIALAKEQVKNAEDLSKNIEFYISQLKLQEKEIKNNHELTKRFNDQIKEMQASFDDATLTAHQFFVEAATIDIERLGRVNAERLFKAQSTNREAEYDGSFINQEFQIDLFRLNQAEKIRGLFQERDALELNKKELEEQLKLYEKLPSQAKQLRDSIEEVTTAIKGNNTALYSLRYDLSNSMINSIKAIYQKQLEMATKAYDNEYKEYEKLINKKIKLIDKSASEEQFTKDVRDKTEALNKIRNEIAQRTGDDSLANMKKLKDLREQLTKGEEDYNNFLKAKNRDDRKQALQEELQDKNDQITKQKEDMNRAFEDLINDTRRFNEMQESLMEGQIDRYKSLVDELTKYVNDKMQDIGRSTSESLLDALSNTFGNLSKLSDMLKEDEKKNSSIPNSTLKPSTISEETIEAIKKVNALSPTTILKDFNITPSNLPKDVYNNKTSTTNNSTKIDQLVKIENFNGSKQETDKLTNDIANALRKQGQI